MNILAEKIRKILLTVLVLLLFDCHVSFAQQVPDLDFEPAIPSPAYPANNGPIVLVDEAHHNFHTIGTRYNAFAKVLTRDGYDVKPNVKPFTLATLKHARILVIANAIHESNVTNWWLPTPSAFSANEISAVRDWVNAGGSLFLIADHMPFPGAAEELAKTFGFTFSNGFATDTTAGLNPGTKRELDLFTKAKGTLTEIPSGGKKSVGSNILAVATFTGQAFQIPPKALSLLTFDSRYKILLPDTAWKFHSDTKRTPINGFSQGAIASHGKGRVAVFGEAAMFTAQLKGNDKIPFGLNAPDAKDNLAFLLSIIHWLDQKD